MDSGFPPVAKLDARVLILGTLPGQMSLQARQYYAQPHNAFWKIMGELVGAHPGLPYEQRLQRLLDARVALWDVCQAAARPGSLDASIDNSTVIANNFDEFLDEHSALQLICFNGAKAASLFRTHAGRHMKMSSAIDYVTLPSTSPAHAALPLSEKVKKWSVILRAGKVDKSTSKS